MIKNLRISLNKGPNGLTFPETTTHKRRYHRSLSSSAKRHKYRTPDLLRPKPFFDTRIDKETGLGARNITTVEGGRAIFVCRIRHLGFNRTVSGACVITRFNLLCYILLDFCWLRLYNFYDFSISALIGIHHSIDITALRVAKFSWTESFSWFIPSFNFTSPKIRTIYLWNWQIACLYFRYFWLYHGYRNFFDFPVFMCQSIWHYRFVSSHVDWRNFGEFSFTSCCISKRFTTIPKR